MAKKFPAVNPTLVNCEVVPSELYLMDIPMAARLMSTTVFAVRELCRSGQLKFVPIGHKWLISPGAIQQFIRERETQVAA